METELKLLINEQDIEKLQELPLLRNVTVGEITVQDLKNVYFDTLDFELWKAKAGLRVRHIDGKCIQTLKAGRWSSCRSAPAGRVGNGRAWRNARF